MDDDPMAICIDHFDHNVGPLLKSMSCMVVGEDHLYKIRIVRKIWPRDFILLDFVKWTRSRILIVHRLVSFKTNVAIYVAMRIRSIFFFWGSCNLIRSI